jgi:hypothetical protein
VVLTLQSAHLYPDFFLKNFILQILNKIIINNEKLIKEGTQKFCGTLGRSPRLTGGETLSNKNYASYL